MTTHFQFRTEEGMGIHTRAALRKTLTEGLYLRVQLRILLFECLILLIYLRQAGRGSHRASLSLSALES